jgi:copper(I)-binding protein
MKIAGDFHDAAAVSSAVAGQDAVIISAAPRPIAIAAEIQETVNDGVSSTRAVGSIEIPASTN